MPNKSCKIRPELKPACTLSKHTNYTSHNKISELDKRMNASHITIAIIVYRLYYRCLYNGTSVNRFCLLVIKQMLLSNAVNETLNACRWHFFRVCCTKYPNTANNLLILKLKILRIWTNAATWCHSEFNPAIIDNSMSHTNAMSYKTVLHVYHSKSKSLIA